MRATFLASSALVGSLLMTTLYWSSAQATSVTNLKSAFSADSAVTLVGRGGGGGGNGGGGNGGGGGGGGGGGNGGGGGHGGGGGDGGGSAAVNNGGGGGGGGEGHDGRGGGGDNGGGRAALSDGPGGGGPGYKGGRMARGDFPAERRGDRSVGGENWKGKHAGDNWKDKDNWKGKHVDRDHHDKFKRHRVFRNGVWVSVYGSDYYASDDCYWLRRRAIMTGDPYWWERYNACRYYY